MNLASIEWDDTIFYSNYIEAIRGCKFLICSDNVNEPEKIRERARGCGRVCAGAWNTETEVAKWLNKVRAEEWRRFSSAPKKAIYSPVNAFRAVTLLFRPLELSTLHVHGIKMLLLYGRMTANPNTVGVSLGCCARYQFWLRAQTSSGRFAAVWLLL